MAEKLACDAKDCDIVDDPKRFIVIDLDVFRMATPADVHSFIDDVSLHACSKDHVRVVVKQALDKAL